MPITETSQIRVMKQDGVRVFPITLTSAIYDKTGKYPIEDLISKFQEDVDGLVDGSLPIHSTENALKLDNHEPSYFATADHNHDKDYAEKEHTHSDLHTHGNKTVIDKFSEDENGDVVYNNAKITTDLSDYSTTSQTENMVDTKLEPYAKTSDVNEQLDGKAEKNHNHDNDYDAKGSADAVAEDLADHEGNTTAHITATERTNWNDANSKKHEHGNKAVLDATTASYTTEAQTKLNASAPLASPKLTGTPTAPTADAGTSTTQVATTAFATKAVGDHNVSGTAHDDLRQLISDLDERLNGIADSDDTTLDQLSEIVAYIKNNKELIDNVTTSKVNVSDIIDVLTSTASNKPLSANQGRALKALIDSLETELNDHMTEIENGTVKVAKAVQADSANAVAWGNVSGKPDTYAPSTHTHNYAGSSSAGGSATSAVKLDTSAGSATQPVYFNGGKPVATTYTLGKSVPSDAKFTDTTYSNFVKSGSGAKAGLVPAPSTTAGTTKYLREDGTWQVPPDTNTTQLGETNTTAYRGDRGATAYNHSQSAHAPSNAQANVIETVKVNGTALTPSSKAVNVTVPTKTSQLTNDSGFKTTDNNTTYSLTKSGSTITLTGSDGSTTSVTDSNTTYNLGSFGVTATAAELNYTDGVTSNIQTQLNGKAASGHNHDSVYAAKSHTHDYAASNHNHSGVYAAASHSHSSVSDSSNGSATTFAYSKSGLTTTSWFAAWNGYELRAISPSATLSVIGAASSSHNHDSAYAAKSHTHSYAASSHNHAASNITAGTFGATGVVAATGTDYTTNRIRNTVFTTSDPGAGASTSYANGSLIAVYE